ncbi:glycosyltransferase family 4 protein [Paenibacillus sp. FSL L8-0494]|uniref:glycosyltransferase family 4 protein n=1 Tax=Paenibacillus sp. FSL L8-0494 TaxID=2975352 RepID=UPI0030FCF50E
MKLIFPVLTLSRGGAQRMLAELANRLSEIGHEITILLPSDGVVEYEINCELRYAADDDLSASDFPVGDVIVSNFYTTVEVSQQASNEGKGIHIRLALCYEPTFLPDNSRSFASYSLTSNLLVLSRWQQEIVQMNHGIKGTIVPIGVNPVFRNLNIREPENKLVVSAVMRKPEGGFSGHREQDYLLEQLNRVRRLHPEVELYLIIPPGEFAESTTLQTLLMDERYHIRTPANDTELCYHYSESDIFVSSSTYDTGSLPGIEAMRCGAALVTVYSGGNMEYGRHGHNCLMSYRFENRLADDIITLINDPDLRQRLARKGEQDSQHFTWEKSTQLFQNALFEIVARNS